MKQSSQKKQKLTSRLVDDPHAELLYDPEVGGHPATIEPKYHSLIRTTIEEPLRFEPETATRNRKQLERSIDLGAR